jgi:hypothetical protein
MIGVKLQLMVQDVSVSLARQVEIGMMREIDDRVLIGGSKVIDLQLIAP